MKVLIIGLDKNIFDSNSPVAKRFKKYGELVDRCDVIVLGSIKKFFVLSDKVTIFGVGGGNKVSQVLFFILKAPRIIILGNYEVISTRDPYFLGLVVVLFAKIFNLGLEVQVHGFEKLNILRKIIASFVLSQADSVRAVSLRLKNILITDFKLSDHLITVSPIYIKCQNFMVAGQKKQNVERSIFTFITVSRLVPIKNIQLQIEALAELSHNQIKADLIIVGEGLERSKLETLAKRLHIESNVLFVGPSDDVVQYLTLADCFLLTSLSEGYGLAPIEAACFGLPVIMSDVGCAGEIIIDKENGLVIPINDSRALIMAMEKIISDDELRQNIIQANRHICNKLPTFDSVLTLYRKSWNKAFVNKTGKSH